MKDKVKHWQSYLRFIWQITTGHAPSQYQTAAPLCTCACTLRAKHTWMCTSVGCTKTSSNCTKMSKIYIYYCFIQQRHKASIYGKKVGVSFIPSAVYTPLQEMLECCEHISRYWLPSLLSSQHCRTERNQPVMNDGSRVNEKSTGKHKALNAQPYWLLTGANNISIALTETNHTFPPPTTQVLDRNKFFPLIKQ